MADSDLLFQLKPATSGALLFGETAAPAETQAYVTTSFAPLTATIRALTAPLGHVSASFAPLTATIRALPASLGHVTASFAPLSVSIYVAPVTQVSVNASFAPLTANVVVTCHPGAWIMASFAPLQVAAQAQYNSNTARPTVGQTAAPWQIAQAVSNGATARHQTGTTNPVGWQDSATHATALPSPVESRLISTLRDGAQEVAALFTAGTAAGASADATHADALRTQRPSVQGPWQNATPLRHSTTEHHQDATRGSRNWARTAYQTACHFSVRAHRDQYTSATPWHMGRKTRFQDGRVPPAGISYPPTPPVPPILSTDAKLLFWQPWDGLPWLLFGNAQAVVPAPETVIIQALRIYMIVNNVSLRRVDGNVSLPVTNMALSLDVDSWTWGFNASLPGSSLQNLEPASNGAPVEVEASINGEVYRALIEGISRSREFGKSEIRVTGRGKAALLDAPYAPTLNFGNAGNERTAQQLINDVLSVNGVSLGWSVNWELTDWLIPAGVFTHQGSYISAVNEIVQAAGGYLQPHASTQTLSVLARYPTLPWNWGTTPIDFELPSNVTTREGVDWQERARYNRVYVSGVQQGVVGQVTRAGTAGDLLAPMVTHALITHADAARQRGGAILANTGRIANVNLRLPVLAQTGVIKPGKMVRYIDAGESRIGIVRSVSVEVGFPEVWQSIGVETHVN